jgi:thiol:disulfide interchange protein
VKRLGVVALLLLGGAAAAWKIVPARYNASRLAAWKGRRIYDEKADPAAQVQAALARAGAEHKRVLVIFGGNWCQWCLALDDLINTDPEIHQLAEEHFVVVHVDSANAEALDQAWGKPIDLGVPVLVFLDPSGKVVHVQESISLEAFGGRLLLHDRDRVLATLRKWG